MLEEVLHLRKRGLFVEKLLALERGKQAIQFLFGLGDDLLDQAYGELPTNDRELLQQGFLVWCEAVNTRGKNALYGRGNMEVGQGFCRRGGSQTCPSTDLLLQHPLLSQLLHHLFHEKRRALGLVENKLLEGVERCVTHPLPVSFDWAQDRPLPSREKGSILTQQNIEKFLRLCFA
jgi:hypothetical protein